MTVYIKRSGAWVSVPIGGINVKSGGVWLAPRRVYVKRSGAWVDTGYLGKPGRPRYIGINGWDFNTIGAKAIPPLDGAPYSSIKFRIYNQYGADLGAEQLGYPIGGDYNYYAASWSGLSQDTKYIVRAFAVSADGVYSNASDDLRPWLGHSAQYATVADYGWGNEQITTPSQIGGTSAEAGYPGSNAVNGSLSDSWVSGARTGQTFGTFWEGLVLGTPGGNRLWTKARVFCPVSERVFIGVFYNGAWFGGATPEAIGLYTSGFIVDGVNQDAVYQDVLVHNWLAGNGDLSSYPKVFDLESYGLNLSSVNSWNVGITGLQPYDWAYRAIIHDIQMTYKDWVQVGSHQVTTVTAQANQFW